MGLFPPFGKGDSLRGMRTLPPLLALVAVLSLTGVAGAQDKPRQGVFVNGALGTAYHTDSPSIDPFSPFWVHFSVRVGYAIDEHLAFVADSIGNAVYGSDRLPLSDVDVILSGNVFQHGVGAQYFLLEGPFTPYLKTGVAIAWAMPRMRLSGFFVS